MLIIEMVLLPAQPKQLSSPQLDSTALIHNILPSAHDSALIPPSPPLTIRRSSLSNVLSKQKFCPNCPPVEEVSLIAQA